MKKVKKYCYLHVLQGNYGFGWEDLTAEDKSSPFAWSRIKRNKMDYLLNAPCPLRIITRREALTQKVHNT
jgi:hypothetical protein